MRKYIPISEIEAKDPERAVRMRARQIAKIKRRRARDPEKARAKERARYAATAERQRELDRAFYAKNKETILARKRARRKARPEADIAYKVRYRAEKRANWIVSNTKQEAKRKGVKFDISVEWVQSRLDVGLCELSGLPFNLDTKTRKDAPSIDRRVPSGDYVESNCRLILFGLNSLLRAKGDAGVEYAVERIHELRAKEFYSAHP